MNATLHDRVDNTSCHGLGIGDNDATEANVYNLLSLLMSRVDEVDEIRRSLPFLGADFRIFQEPVTY